MGEASLAMSSTSGGISMARSRSLFLFVAALFALNFLAACSTQPQKPVEPPDTRAADEATIRANVVAWSQASQAKDVNKALSFYADDAIQMPDRGALVKGRENMRKGWEQMFALPGPGLTFATTGVEVARSGDIAYEYGTYDLATKDAKGRAHDEKGKYLVAWKKQADGSWKAVVDIDNPDGAPAQAPAKRKTAAHKRRHRKTAS
jgi:uncharacterized protein (TIGR02246 family)